MKRIWIGTNWKMTKTIEEGISYTKELKRISEMISDNIELFIIPPYTSLVTIKGVIRDSRIQLGAQNMHWEDSGAFTGEISPKMLDEIGINLIELGHSERRQYFNENDEDLNKKVHAALKYHFRPLICIGENRKQKEQGISKEVLASQIKVCLRNVPEEQALNVMIAYEPVWAIGENGVPADAGYVREVHAFLRDTLNQLYPSVGKEIPILYGGSVNKDNFLQYIDVEHVNGLFIGRAAWDIESFECILKSLDTHLFKKMTS